MIFDFQFRSADDCRAMMERADADENDGVSYEEFVDWLERNDPGHLGVETDVHWSKCEV